MQMNRIVRVATVSLLAAGLTACSALDSLGGVPGADGIAAASDAYKAVSLSDEEIQKMAKQFANTSDAQSKVAPKNSAYAKRLRKLVRKHHKEDGMKLNFKVYLDPEINAFALADGSIRINSGLMDAMDDEELLSVIGHEIGHVKHGHSKSAIKTAYAASAAAKAGSSAAGAKAGAAGKLGADVVGKMLQDVVNAQFSQSQEEEADDYGFKFMKRNKYSPEASPRALRKLGDGGGGLLASHPAPQDRAARLEKRLKK